MRSYIYLRHAEACASLCFENVVEKLAWPDLHSWPRLRITEAMEYGKLSCFDEFTGLMSSGK